MYIAEKRLKMPYKTIKEVTKLTGITESALRYYDEKGILHPSRKNASGRREWLYDDAAVSRLKVIRMYKQIEIPMSEIGKILNSMDCDRTEAIADQLESLRKKREHLERQIVVTEFLENIEEGLNGRHIEDTQLLDVVTEAVDKLIGK